MLNGPLSRMLAHTDLGMIDAVHHRSGLPGPHTFIRGSRQIDGAWVTLDVDIDRACFLPFYFGVGDHRGILMDVPQRTILGGDIHKISRPAARRLSCNKREVMGKYNDLLEIFCSQHRIQQKLYTLFPPTFPPSPAIAAKMEVIDRVLGEGMIHAEKKNVAKSRRVKFLLATNSLQQVAVLNYGVWLSGTNDPITCLHAPFVAQLRNVISPTFSWCQWKRLDTILNAHGPTTKFTKNQHHDYAMNFYMTRRTRHAPQLQNKPSV